MTRTFKKVVDIAIVYELVKRLATPFENTEAFKLGIIDAEGNNLKPRDLLSDKEAAAYTYFDTLVFNLKKLINKLPGGEMKLKTFAIALWLLREEKGEGLELLALQEEHLLDYLTEAEHVLVIPEKDYGSFMEDGGPAGGGPTSNTTTSTGIASQGPVISNKAMRKWKTSNHLGSRCYHVDESTFVRCVGGKTDHERFAAFIDEPDMLEDMRGYAKKHYDQPILVHNEKIGSYHFLKFGRRFRSLRYR